MICSLALFLLASTADDITAAKSALDDGLPAVAINKLENTVHPAKDADAVLILARAYLADGKPGKAVELLNSHPVGKEGDFWLGQSHAALGRWNEALEKYRSCLQDTSLAPEALLGTARMLRNLGRSREAVDILLPAKEWAESPLRHLAIFETAGAFLDLGRPGEAKESLESLAPSDRREKSRRDYLMAECLSMQGDDTAAIALFDAVAPVDTEMAVGAAIGQARSLVHNGQSPAAENLLEDFLSKNSNLPGLAGVFAVLDSIYATQPAASSSELKRWAEDGDPSLRKSLAAFYLARFEGRLGREDRVEKLLENVVTSSRDTNVSEMASLELAAVRLKQGRAADAMQLLPPKGTSARADYLGGLALAALNEPLKASEWFVSAASNNALAESALYNAAVCDFLAGDTKSKGYNLLKERYPESPKLNALLLRKGYELARLKDNSAPVFFENLAKSTDARIASQASLALAEWKYETDDRAGARQELLRASTKAASTQDPRSDALAVFLSDDGKSDDAAIAAARKFLAAHPETSAEPEVMMKLGELFFRKGDFAGARVQFESLAKKYPGTDLEFPALFLAAQSASRLQTPSAVNDAMLLFEEVASSNSPLAIRARFEQAVLQNVLGKPGEAIVILDRIAGSNSTGEIKTAALIEKGKTLYSMGEKDPQSYRAAIDVWKRIAEDPASSIAWRNQALARIGSAYEKLGDPDASLASYYDVLKDGKGAARAFFWYYKAGFAAARLLESSKRWDQAIKVYEMIAAAGGPRSGEATARINKIRLENFLWDENPGT